MKPYEVQIYQRPNFETVTVALLKDGLLVATTQANDDPESVIAIAAVEIRNAFYRAKEQ